MFHANPAPGDDPQAQALYAMVGRNADIDSFTVHVRSLLDFFYAKRRFNDGVAGDLFDTDDEWNRLCPKMTPELELINQRVGKEVAHISDHHDTESPIWFYEDICRTP